jgi:hypothetical protein
MEIFYSKLISTAIYANLAILKHCKLIILTPGELLLNAGPNHSLIHGEGAYRSKPIISSILLVRPQAWGMKSEG